MAKQYPALSPFCAKEKIVVVFSGVSLPYWNGSSDSPNESLSPLQPETISETARPSQWESMLLNVPLVLSDQVLPPSENG